MTTRSLVVFIGSSREGQPYADALQTLLEQRRADIEPVVWSTGAFSVGRTNIENLIKQAKLCDYAILLVTGDDVTSRRGDTFPSPRDNVVFEIGLFMGHLGRDRTVIVCDSRVLTALPTDLLGLVVVPFRAQGSEEAPRPPRQAMGGALSPILELLETARPAHAGR